jgi:hypothetical protein
MIARQKDSGFGWKLEDFEFRAAFTIVQHFHFFEKKIWKIQKKYKTYYKKYEMVELSFKNDICIIALAWNMFSFLFDFSKKKIKCKCWTIVNAVKFCTVKFVDPIFDFFPKK